MKEDRCKDHILSCLYEKSRIGEAIQTEGKLVAPDWPHSRAGGINEAGLLMGMVLVWGMDGENV